jgi:DNA repair exonuclease SbcCD ATPase subunit
MQQDDEDRKNKIIIKGLEDKFKELEDSLKEKDKMLCSAEGSVAEAQTQNKKLSKDLLDAQALLKENFNQFKQENEALKAKLKVESEKNSKLSEAMKALKERCFEFASQCTARLRSIFDSVGAASKETSLSTEDIPWALECIEKEVDVLDKVITGHKDFCALVASRDTAAAFIKARCNHAKSINRPNFNLSSSDLVDIPTESRSIGNRFITQIWAKGRRELAGDEARKLLNTVWNFTFVFYL